MYTSEIRETDQEGKPVAVSPSLLARVRETDEELRDRIGSDSELEYVGRWIFPEPEKALLSLSVQVPNVQEAFAVALPFNPKNGIIFPSHAVQTVLREAGRVLQERINRRLRGLLDDSAEDE